VSRRARHLSFVDDQRDVVYRQFRSVADVGNTVAPAVMLISGVDDDLGDDGGFDLDVGQGLTVSELAAPRGG
jgi:hypothetical protein